MILEQQSKWLIINNPNKNKKNKNKKYLDN